MKTKSKCCGKSVYTKVRNKREIKVCSECKKETVPIKIKSIFCNECNEYVDWITDSGYWRHICPINM